MTRHHVYPATARSRVRAGPGGGAAVLPAGSPHAAAQSQCPNDDQGYQSEPEQEMQRGNHQRDDHEHGEHSKKDQDQTSHGPTICHHGDVPVRGQG